MALGAPQYRILRDLFRAMLSVEGIGPTDGAVLSFYQQLMLDSSGAAALTATRNFICAQVFRGILSGNASAPTDSDVVAFWNQLASDASAVSAMGATAPYRKMRDALRGAISCDALNPSDPDVLGYFGGLAQIIPISSAYWATGGWWDLYDITGTNGATFSATVAGKAGSSSFTPTSPSAMPIIDDGGPGGRRGLLLSRATLNYLENDTLAAIANGTNKPWTVVWDFQKNLSQTTQVMCGFGSTTSGGTRDFIEFTNTIGEALELNEHSAAGGATTYDTAQQNGYDYTRYAVTWDGVTGKSYVNGTLVTITPSAFDAAAMVLNRFGWGAAQVSAVGFLGSNGWIRRLGARVGAATAAEVAQIDAAMVAFDLTLPYSSAGCPQYIMAGASILYGTSDAVTGGGYRYHVSEYIRQNRRSWASVGARQGLFGNARTPALGGQAAPAITAMVTGNATSRTKLVIVDFGNGEINAGQTAPQTLTAITTALATIRAALYALNAQCRIVVMNLCPYFEVGFQAVAIDVNASLPGVWDASDAAFPGSPKLHRCDINTAIGGPTRDAANFGVGDNHPNNTGYNLLGPALLACSNGSETLAQTITNLSPT